MGTLRYLKVQSPAGIKYLTNLEYFIVVGLESFTISGDTGQIVLPIPMESSDQAEPLLKLTATSRIDLSFRIMDGVSHYYDSGGSNLNWTDLSVQFTKLRLYFGTEIQKLEKQAFSFILVDQNFINDLSVCYGALESWSLTLTPSRNGIEGMVNLKFHVCKSDA